MSTAVLILAGVCLGLALVILLLVLITHPSPKPRPSIRHHPVYGPYPFLDPSRSDRWN